MRPNASGSSGRHSQHPTSSEDRIQHLHPAFFAANAIFALVVRTEQRKKKH